jgi:hypothetical protein
MPKVTRQRALSDPTHSPKKYSDMNIQNDEEDQGYIVGRKGDGVYTGKNSVKRPRTG